MKDLDQYLEMLKQSGIEDIFIKPVAKAGSEAFEQRPVLSRQKVLEGLQHKYADCQKCGLWEGRNKLVYGVGDANAKLMLIGEAPGADEDRTGIAFVGRAGQLLTKMLNAINLEREQVYIANIVKCRPPGNRDPLEEERQSCLPYLLEQIRIIEPQIILLLGKVAGNTLLKNNLTLGRMREEEYTFMGIPTYVSYHPSALLRHGEWKKPAWIDLQRVRDHYQTLPAK
jgi:uracil-DNA glycosylase